MRVGFQHKQGRLRWPTPPEGSHSGFTSKMGSRFWGLLRFKGTRAKRAYPFVRPSMSTVTALRKSALTAPARPNPVVYMWYLSRRFPPSFCLSEWGGSSSGGGHAMGPVWGSRLTFPYLGAWTFDETCALRVPRSPVKVRDNHIERQSM